MNRTSNRASRRKIKFKALAPVLKGKDKGKLKWFEGVLTGDGAVYIGTKNMGIQLLKDVKALCQYTGLKDKNGKEIYEGDIIKGKSPHSYYYSEQIYVVKFGWAEIKTGLCDNELYNIVEAVEAEIIGFYAESEFEVVSLVEVEDIEVIGNIYDNPELVEGQR